MKLFLFRIKLIITSLKLKIRDYLDHTEKAFEVEAKRTRLQLQLSILKKEIAEYKDIYWAEYFKRDTSAEHLRLIDNMSLIRGRMHDRFEQLKKELELLDKVEQRKRDWAAGE